MGYKVTRIGIQEYKDGFKLLIFDEVVEESTGRHMPLYKALSECGYTSCDENTLFSVKCCFRGAFDDGVDACIGELYVCQRDYPYNTTSVDLEDYMNLFVNIQTYNSIANSNGFNSLLLQ